MSLSCFVTEDQITDLYSRQGLTYTLNASIKRDLSRDTKRRTIEFAQKWARESRHNAADIIQGCPKMAAFL